jgi:hypothetical protein
VAPKRYAPYGDRCYEQLEPDTKRQRKRTVETRHAGFAIDSITAVPARIAGLPELADRARLALDAVRRILARLARRSGDAVGPSLALVARRPRWTWRPWWAWQSILPIRTGHAGEPRLSCVALRT